MLEQKSNWRKVFLIILIILVLIGLGIGGYFIYIKQTNITQTATLISPSPKPSPSGPLVSSRNDPNGPYYHQIYSATSTDGITWTKLNTLLFEHASVPGAVIKNQKIYLYFVDASGNEDQLSVAISSDLGKTFEKQKVSIQDNPAAVDPHPELVNGKIRLYYMSSTFNPQSQEPSDFKIYSAESNDGINFDNPVKALESSEIITDPDVFQTDIDWRMFISKGTNLVLAISQDDGITFQEAQSFSWNKGGVCDTAKMGETLRTFYCGEGVIKSATGAESGKLTSESGTRIEAGSGKIVCDPSIVQLPDGTYLMFYKIQEIKEQQNNQPQNQPPKL